MQREMDELEAEVQALVPELLQSVPEKDRARVRAELEAELAKIEAESQAGAKRTYAPPGGSASPAHPPHQRHSHSHGHGHDCSSADEPELDPRTERLLRQRARERAAAGKHATGSAVRRTSVPPAKPKAE